MPCRRGIETEAGGETDIGTETEIEEVVVAEVEKAVGKAVGKAVEKAVGKAAGKAVGKEAVGKAAGNRFDDNTKQPQPNYLGTPPARAVLFLLLLLL